MCFFCMEEVKSKIFINTHFKAALKKIMMVISVRLICFFYGSCKADIYIRAQQIYRMPILLAVMSLAQIYRYWTNMSPICTFCLLNL